MGEDTHSPTVGLVVPDATVMSDVELHARRIRNEFFTPDRVEVAPAPWVDYAALNSAQVDEDDTLDSGPGRPTPELSIALQAVQSAIEGLRTVKPGLLQHQLDAALMDTFAHLGLATRAIEQEMRRKAGGR